MLPAPQTCDPMLQAMACPPDGKMIDAEKVGARKAPAIKVKKSARLPRLEIGLRIELQKECPFFIGKYF